MGAGCSVSELSVYHQLGFPPELIEKIIQFISNQDKLICRLVCREWNDFLSYSSYFPGVEFRVRDNADVVLSSLMTSTTSINWERFTFAHTGLESKTFSFWETYSNIITHLEFKDCHIIRGDCGENQLQKYCPNLKHLTITQCGEEFLSHRKENEFLIIKLLHLDNLESLSLSRNKYLSDYILLKILFETKCLQSLNLSHCGMIFVNSIFHRFYPRMINVPDMIPWSQISEDVLTFEMFCLAYLVTRRAENLTELVMDGTRINKVALDTICNLKTFGWKSIGLNWCSEIKVIQLVKFGASPNLTSLGISACSLTANQIEQLLLNFPNIVILDISKTNLKNLSTLGHMIHLKDLDISHTPALIESEGKYLTELANLTSLNLTGIYELNSPVDHPTIPVVLIAMFTKLKKLTTLKVGYAKSVTDEVVQAIIENLPGLRELSLEVTSVTDLGIAGRYIQKCDCEDSECLCHITTTQENRENFLKWQNECVPGYCLSSMRSLKVLNIAHCRNLGLATWELGLNLPYLEGLNISYCHVSRDGFVNILKNCRSLIWLRTHNLTRHSLSNSGDLFTESKDQILLDAVAALPRLKRSSDWVFGIHS